MTCNDCPAAWEAVYGFSEVRGLSGVQVADEGSSLAHVFQGRTVDIQTMEESVGSFSQGGESVEQSALALYRRLAEDGVAVLSLERAEGLPAMLPYGNPDNRDYAAFLSQGNPVWITVGVVSICLTVNGGEGIIADMYALGTEGEEEALASTGLMFSEALDFIHSRKEGA